MPEGAEPTITDRDFTVATIIAPGGASDEEETAEADGADDAEAEGAEDSNEGGEE